MNDSTQTQNSLLKITGPAQKRLTEILKQKNLTDANFRLFIEGFG